VTDPYGISQINFDLPYLPSLPRPRLDPPLYGISFSILICRTFLPCPDQDLIPCPRLDLQICSPDSTAFHFSNPICCTLFLSRPRFDSLFSALISVMAFQFQFLNCRTLAQDSCLIPFYGIAAPQGTTSSILILVLQAILWLWQVAVIQAKIIILLEDWRFTPTIAPALDQSGVFPVEV